MRTFTESIIKMTSYFIFFQNFTTLTLVKKEGDEELKATGC